MNLPELSQIVADKYGVPETVKQITGWSDEDGYYYKYTHLYQDVLRLDLLCIEHIRNHPSKVDAVNAVRLKALAKLGGIYYE